MGVSARFVNISINTFKTNQEKRKFIEQNALCSWNSSVVAR